MRERWRERWRERRRDGESERTCFCAALLADLEVVGKGGVG